MSWNKLRDWLVEGCPPPKHPQAPPIGWREAGAPPPPLPGDMTPSERAKALKCQADEIAILIASAEGRAKAFKRHADRIAVEIARAEGQDLSRPAVLALKPGENITWPCPDDVLAGEASTDNFDRVTAGQICRKAAGLVVGTRAEQHGDWNVVFTRIAALWSAFLGVPISAKQAALMMVQFKTIRADTGNYNPDDFVDIAGYGGGAGEIAAQEARSGLGRDRDTENG